MIVVDDEDRENEGDFIIAAEAITPEKVNFMLQHGRGVLCCPITEQRCAELDLMHQVANNTSMLGTPFTVTVDKLEGCTTGVSAADRAATISALADPKSKPETFGRPGHINPLYARAGGVLQRAGHTEAGVDLARLAGFQPAAALIEIMNADGTMARMPQLQEVAKEFDLKIITIKDLIAYRLEKESVSPKDGLCSVSPKDGLSGEAGLSAPRSVSSAVYLARPWRWWGETVWAYTTWEKGILNPEGWSTGLVKNKEGFNPENACPNSYEYRSQDKSVGRPKWVSVLRKPILPNGTQLKPREWLK